MPHLLDLDLYPTMLMPPLFFNAKNKAIISLWVLQLTNTDPTEIPSARTSPSSTFSKEKNSSTSKILSISPSTVTLKLKKKLTSMSNSSSLKQKTSQSTELTKQTDWLRLQGKQSPPQKYNSKTANQQIDQLISNQVQHQLETTAEEAKVFSQWYLQSRIDPAQLWKNATRDRTKTDQNQD